MRRASVCASEMEVCLALHNPIHSQGHLICSYLWAWEIKENLRYSLYFIYIFFLPASSYIYFLPFAQHSYFWCSKVFPIAIYFSRMRLRFDSLFYQGSVYSLPNKIYEFVSCSLSSWKQKMVLFCLLPIYLLLLLYTTNLFILNVLSLKKRTVAFFKILTVSFMYLYIQVVNFKT